MKKRALRKISHIASSRFRAILAIFLIVLIASFLVTGSLEFETDIFGLIQGEKGPLKLLLDNLRDFGTLDHLFFMLTRREGASIQDLIGAAESLAVRLRELRVDGKRALGSVQFRTIEAGDYEGLKPVLEIFLANPELFLGRQDISGLSRKLTDEAIGKQVRQNRAMLLTQASLPFKEFIALDPLGLREILMDHFRQGARGFAIDYRSGYFLSQNHRSLLIIANPIRPAADLTFSQKLIQAIDPLLDVGPEVSIQYTGAYPIVLERAAGLRLDMQSSMITAFVLVLALFLFAYRRLITVLFVGFPLMVGVQITLAMAALFIGRLNILTSAFAAILIGLGIDFAIHLYDRYHSERALGLEVSQAMEKTLTETGSGVLTGGATTVLAFCTLLLARVDGIMELGALVAAGLFFCLISIYFVLPSFLAWRDSRGKHPYGYPPLRDFGLKALSRLLREYPCHFIIAFSLITACFLVFALRIGFEGDIRSLGPRRTEAVEIYDHLERTFPRGNREAFVVLEDDDLESLLKREESLLKGIREYQGKGGILSVSSISQLIPSTEEQRRRRQLLRQSIDFVKARNILIRELLGQGFKLDPFEQALRWMDDFSRSVDDYAPVMPETVLPKLQSSPLAKWMNRCLVRKGGIYKGIVTVLYEGDNVDLAQLGKDLKEIDQGAGITGIDLVNIDLFRMVRRDLLLIAPLAILSVVLLLYLHFRRWRVVILAIIPLSVGITWMLGLASLFGWKINYISGVVIPMVVGIGIDDGIHIIHRYLEESRYDIQGSVQYTGRAVAMTSFTTMIGFGSLVTAQYQVLSSMGWTIILGIGSCLLASLFLLPPLLVIFLRPDRGEKQRNGL
jgi:predicted RND superfamily exporter protein